jgi:hypothetical protein
VVENKKLGIIVPYRDRQKHLKEFSRRIVRYLEKTNIDFHVFVIEQDFARLFNRGMLLNVGFKYAEKFGCDYVVFHDVDMLPIHVDYSYDDKPLHLANNFLNDDIYSPKETFDEYFGGVTMFPIEQFKKVNGYSNKYWGWGYEDTDLLYRCVRHKLPLNDLKLKNLGKPQQVLKFNGHNSYVECRNKLNINNDITFFVSFYPDDIIYDFKKDSDEFVVFSIPGYDMSISYNSFSRYNFCTFDKDLNVLYVNSNIKTNYKTNISVTINKNKEEIKVYQDGRFIDMVNFYTDLYPYNDEKNFYLGVGKPSREIEYKGGDSKYFKGYITSFASFDKVLTEDEIYEISQNDGEDLTKNFGNYVSSKNLSVYYDTKQIEKYELVDLSGNGNYGRIVNCEISDVNLDEYKTIKIPERRESTFALLDHKENGFHRNKWRSKATRWNQLRFNNEVKQNVELIYDDGLSDLEFVEYGVNEINEHITHINVGL